MHYTGEGRRMILENVAKSLSSHGYMTMENRLYSDMLSDQTENILLSLGFERVNTIVPVNLFGKWDPTHPFDTSLWTNIYRLK